MSERILSKKSLLVYLPLIITAALALNGCGFKLRGLIEVPEHLKVLHLEANDKDVVIFDESKRALKANGIAIASTPDKAPYTLEVLSFESKKREIAVSSNFRDAEEFELRLKMIYEIRGRDGYRLVMPTTILTERIFTNDENQVRAKDREEELLLAEMRRDMIQQMLRQIQALKSKP